MKGLLNTIPVAMQERIKKDLRAIEHEYNVTVLYACESGSRAWGFASPDSDYDVRFLYVHKLPWYLTIKEGRDVIERPIIDELDINGWDLRKALRLLQVNNPALLEWLQSPIVYYQHEIISELQQLATQLYSPLKAYYHYAAMAKKNFRSYLQADEVRYKKYLYVLRPLLAVKWVEAELGTPPPILFDELVAKLVKDPALLTDITELLVLKKQANEAEYGPRRAVIQEFIEDELARIYKVPEATDKKQVATQQLDEFLYKVILMFNK